MLDFAMPRPRKTKRNAEHDRAVGRRLATSRRARGLTQVQVAEKLGVGQSVVSQYENGITGLDGRVLLQLCRLLRVASDELLGLKVTNDPTSKIQRPFIKRLEKVERLSRRDQAALLRTIDAFLSRAS